ncbi:MAG: alpha/beta hydrolase [Sphingomicrobium sp.]
MLGLLIALTVTAPQAIPSAVYTDPVHDVANPAGMEVLHIPSGGVEINAVAYLAAGAGPHPTLLIMHGLPGNEKNLDLAQAVRRAGWNAITFNYRGSWGSPGHFSFAGNLEDGRNVLDYLRRPEVDSKLRIDRRRIVLAGHSMGDWVAALTAEADSGLAGVILISGANMGYLGSTHAALVADMATDMETLATTTPDAMAAELERNAGTFDWTPRAAGLGRTPLLVLSSDDGLAPNLGQLAKRVRASANSRVTEVHVATDHSWSDARIRLQSEVIGWLQALPRP